MAQRPFEETVARKKSDGFGFNLTFSGTPVVIYFTAVRAKKLLGFD